MATVRRGSKGELVITVQTALVSHGYDVGSYGIDGDFGPDTEAAVKQFQSDRGLTVDGIVGSATAAALGINLDDGSSASMPTAKKSSSLLLFSLGVAAVGGFVAWKLTK